jgi:hypothetical protein
MHDFNVKTLKSYEKKCFVEYEIQAIIQKMYSVTRLLQPKLIWIMEIFPWHLTIFKP